MQQRDYFLHGEGKSSKGQGIVTGGIRKVFVNSTIKSGGLKELEFGGTSPCISKRGVGVD